MATALNHNRLGPSLSHSAAAKNILQVQTNVRVRCPLFSTRVSKSEEFPLRPEFFQECLTGFADRGQLFPRQFSPPFRIFVFSQWRAIAGRGKEPRERDVIHLVI